MSALILYVPPKSLQKLSTPLKEVGEVPQRLRCKYHHSANQKLAARTIRRSYCVCAKLRDKLFPDKGGNNFPKLPFR